MNGDTTNPLRLLLVEDNALDRCVLLRALRYRQRPFYICEAVSVAAASALLQAHEFDVVLASSRLADGDGAMILQLVTSLPQHHPALVILGHEDDDGLDEQCISYGAQAFLIREALQPCVLISTILQAHQHARLQEAMRLHLQQLQERAEHDALTGLYNRHVFDDCLNDCISRGERYGKPFGLLMIDLDKFKRVNDHWGHCTGDALLREAACRIAGISRSCDRACRIGGDEFAILLPELQQGNEPAVLAERLVAALQEPVRTGGRLLRIRASIGIALYPDDGHSALALLAHADLAMYHSKRHGGRLGIPPAGMPAGLPAP